MTYKTEYDFKKSYLLTPDLTDLAIKMPSYSQRFRAKPRLAGWVAPKASFFASENYEGQGEQLPDITTWAQGNLVLSPKAYQALNETLSPSGEFLPLIIGDETYYMLNTLFVVPEEGIDRSQELEKVNSGVHTGQANVLFNEASLSGRSLFKTPTDKLSFSYCTEEFKTRYNQLSFKGLTFEKVAIV